MSDFAAFVKKHNAKVDVTGKPVGEVKQLELAVDTSDAVSGYAVANRIVKKSDVVLIGKKFSGVVFSDDFISELSDAIGKPHLGESKETFIKRCKESLSALIDLQFDSKKK